MWAVVKITCIKKRLRNIKKLTCAHTVLMNENLSSRASGVSVVMLLLSLVLSPALAILHCAIFTGNHVEPPCTVGLPVFCQQRHVGLPALRAPRLVCVSAF